MTPTLRRTTARALVLVAVPLLVAVAAFVALASPVARLADAPPVPRARPQPPATGCTAGPSLDRMIGAMIMVGFDGIDIDDREARRLLDAIGDGQVGGVLFFRRNVASEAAVKRLTRAFARAAPDLPLLVTVDQEGGQVERLTDRVGFREVPSAAWVGNRSVLQARRTYAGLASGLAEWGFNFNLGPVVDLAANPDNPVIAKLGRAYSGDPDRVARFARAFVDTHRRAGVLTSLKHFPGHGSSRGDTHEGSVDVTETWTANELQPFRLLIDEGKADAILLAHVVDQRLSDAPASLSPAVIEDLLRGELGFDGVALTDDLAMGAVAAIAPPQELAIRAVAAGNDIVIFGSGGATLAERLHARFLAEAEDPRFAARIRESWGRIERLRGSLPRQNASPCLATADAR